MEDLPAGEERMVSWEANTLHLSESKEVSGVRGGSDHAFTPGGEAK